MVGVGGRDFRIEPSLSRPQILQWLHEFRRFRYDEPTTLGRRVAELAPTLPSRCLVIVLSDLHDAAAVPALKLLAQQHDVVVIQSAGPGRDGPAGRGLPAAGEAETGRVFVTRAAGSGSIRRRPPAN